MTKLYAQEKRVFDINKVTVVGNPTITSGGVASGFSASNYVTIPVSIYNKKFKISCTLNYTAQQTQQECIYQLNKEGWSNPMVIQANGNIAYYLAVRSSSTAVKNFVYKLPSVGVYTISLEWNGTQYIFTIYNSNNEQIYQDVYASSEWLYCSAEPNTLFVGTSSVSGYYNPLTSHSIDLKSFKIYVDNELVYSPTKPVYSLERRKEGFDLSKFTVVGSPTITEAGVASGFGESKFLQIQNLNINSNTITFNIKFIVPTLGKECRLFNLQTDTTKATRLIIGASTNFYLYSDDGPITSGIIIPQEWVGDTVEASINLTTTGNKVVLENTTKNTRLSSTSNNIRNLVFDTLAIGFHSGGQISTSIDLSQFSITVDGKEVFTGAKETFYAMRGM